MTPRPSSASGAVARALRALAAWLPLLACASTPVGVEQVDAKTVHRELTRNVLSTDSPSDPALQVLRRLDLEGVYANDPVEALAKLRSGLAPGWSADRLFALAELSFHHAETSGQRPYHVAAAVYAYAFLFPENGAAAPDPLDPRTRLAANLYNRGLTEGFERPEQPEIELTAGAYALPFGRLELESDPADFVWAGYELASFYPVADVRVRGLSNRYRQPGIGAALAADLELAPDAPKPEDAEHIPARLKVPVTAFVRLSDARRGIASGSVHGTLEIYAADVARSVRIGARDVPLELEGSASLAYTLSDSPIWDFELKGFFSGDYRPYGGGSDGLWMLSPHDPGRIPVVFVHGTASSPGRWAELVNEMQADAEIRARFEPWLFLYHSGNPIAYSALRLRRSLEDMVRTLDPAGRDPGLRRIVLVGHSQGGLLCKMLVIDSGDRFWSNVSNEPFEQLDLEPDTRELLRGALFVAPLPFVERVVFLATPHRGSYLAGWSVAGLVNRLTRISGRLVSVVPDLIERNPGALVERKLERAPTSVENMNPGHPFIQTLGSIPVSDGVRAHSIIGVRGSGPVEHGSDGVVRYRSAHIEEADSELVVDSGHSLQGNPHTVNEVERILRVHLEAR